MSMAKAPIPWGNGLGLCLPVGSGRRRVSLHRRISRRPCRNRADHDGFRGVHLAKVVAHGTSAPFGTLVLALAVTVIDCAYRSAWRAEGGSRYRRCGAGSTPRSLAAAARADRLQTSLNSASGCSLAMIGLTIPAIAVVSIALDQPLDLKLGANDRVLSALTLYLLSRWALVEPPCFKASCICSSPGSLFGLSLVNGYSLFLI